MKDSERADLIEYWLKRATETLQEIEIHLQNGLLGHDRHGHLTYTK